MTDEELKVFRERGHIEGFLGEWLDSQIIEHYGSLSVGGDDFKALYLEEAQALGYKDDDPTILIRRESDGIVFEVEIDVTVRRAPAKSEQAEAAGQLPLPGVPA